MSGNIKRLRLRINEEFLPRDGIEGHAGNIFPKDSLSSDNTDFVVWLHKSLNFYGDPNSFIEINKENFAPNDRNYIVDYDEWLAQNGTDFLPRMRHLHYGQPSLYE